jgi:hypothetical protein
LNRNDGVVVYIKNHLQAKITELRLVNATGLQIETSGWVFLAIYRSPSHLNADGFINSLDEHLETVSSFKNITVIGDINIDLIIAANERAQERRNRLNYLNTLSLHGLLPAHTYSTRIDSCLDHVILKLDLKLNSAYVAVLNSSVTDHSLVLVKFSNVFNRPTPYYKNVVDIDNACKMLFASDATFLNIYNCPDTFANSFMGMIKAAIQANTTSVTISTNKRILKPWITTGALKCINLRNSMQTKLKNEPNNTILKITYRRYRNYCSNLIRKLRRNHNKLKISKSVNQPKKLWSTINEITQYKPPKVNNIDLLNIKPEPKLSVNYVNNHFVNIGSSLADIILKQVANNHPVSSSPSCSHPGSLVLLDTDHDEVPHDPHVPHDEDNILMSLDSSSACGWDGINISFLKRARDFVVPFICKLANLCFKTGVFPKALKRSVITPVYKRGDKTDVSNFRPISVLTAITRIIEKLINIRVTNYLTKHHIISNYQYGFRRGVSTQDAVLDLTSNIVESVDRGDKSLTVFIDLKSGFDTVSIPILLKRLEDVGIRGIALSLFKSYLQDRTQAVRIDVHVSDEETVKFGVPQGSVLGPTLFLIYINELCNLQVVGGRIFSYADDTAIVFSGKTWDDVYNKAATGLMRVSEWLRDNLLTLNIQKTNYICFALYNTSQPRNDMTIKLHCCSDSNAHTCNCPAINKVSQTKYLGVILDQRLCWRPHLEELISRVRKLIWVFKSLRHIMPSSLLNKIYFALAQSIISYCIPIWGGAAKTDLLALERAQRCLIKVMYFKPRRFPTHALYKISNLLSVRKIFVLNLILNYHKRLPYKEPPQNKRRKVRVAPTPLVRTAFAQRQYPFLSAYMYNKLNTLLEIYPMQSYKCKKTLIQWLDKLTYDEIENLLPKPI